MRSPACSDSVDESFLNETKFALVMVNGHQIQEIHVSISMQNVQIQVRMIVCVCTYSHKLTWKSNKAVKNTSWIGINFLFAGMEKSTELCRLLIN